jgi:hypothetical protein
MQPVLLTACVAAALALGACGGDDDDDSGGAETISSDKIEAVATRSLTKEVGQAPASLDCPSDLEAKVGESEDCTLSDDQGRKYEMKVTLTKVSGDGNFEIKYKVADRPSN